MRLSLCTLYSILVALALSFPSEHPGPDGPDTLALQIREYARDLISRTPNQAPANVRGVNIYWTNNGFMRIWLAVDVVSSSFAEIFGSEGTGHSLANDMGQHFIETISADTTSGQDQGFLALRSGTTINVIYEQAEGGQYTGSIAVDIDATSLGSWFPNFFDDIWAQFIRSAHNYFNGLQGVDVTIHDAITQDQIGQIGGVITNIPNPSSKRDLLTTQVCAKPVDLRSIIQARIPNWSMQQPVKTHC